MFILQKLFLIATIGIIATFPYAQIGEAAESSSRCGLVTLDGDSLTLASEELQIGDKAPDFTLINLDMEEVTEKDYKGKIKVISVMPSIDTPT